MSETQASNGRIVSLDQFRGYTVVGMFLVNFVGGFEASNYVLKHHNTFCSYADTIMPQFLFAVGFAFRLTFTRRVAQLGAATAYARMVRRLLGLILVALIVYTLSPRANTWSQLTEMGIWESIRGPLKREWFQTLTHIAVTSLWILPVIRTSARTRLSFMLASAALHLIVSQRFYFLWVNNGQPNGIDGGPLGFLTWTIPAVTGTLACDLVTSGQARRGMWLMVFWSLVLMTVGYVLSCGTRFYDVPDNEIAVTAERMAVEPVVPTREAWNIAYEKVKLRQWTRLLAEPPFVAPPHPPNDIRESYRLRQWNYWMMCQRAGTISYLTFAAGFSLAVYALFHFCCDWMGWQLGVFRTFGSNALVAYVLHMLVDGAVTPYMPRDAPAWYMWCGCAAFMAITYLLVRTLEKNRIYIRL